MTVARFLLGDVFERLAEISTGSVDLVVTSPPFLALRSYLPADHPDKAKEIGSEASPAEFLDTLLQLTAEWGRVLAPHGSITVELGDTYAGSGGAGGDYGTDGLRTGQQRFDGSAARAARNGDQPRPELARTRAQRPGWPLDKSLTGIPTLYAWSLAYGRNLLTGGESPAGQWRIRNVVAWVRPNPPVGELFDKFRQGTSYITIATRSRTRWFDAEAVRGAPVDVRVTKVGRASASRGITGGDSGNPDKPRLSGNPLGSPMLDWWEITTAGYPGAHYAVMPAEIPKRLIASMCPHRVCTTCGQPSRRIVETAPSPIAPGDRIQRDNDDSGRLSIRANGRTHIGIGRQAWTVGWSDCGHDSWRRGLVLDPFAGSGTTLAVASGMGRDSIGIDFDARNVDLARQRVGMFLDVDEPAAAP